jgi:hypothetical protein
MRINPFVYGLLVLVVFLGIILGFQAAGIWSVSGKVTASGEKVEPSAGDVNTIKGWMTLEQISSVYQVPLAEIINQFGLPADISPTTAIKDLENDLFSVTNLRTWLQSRDNEVTLPQVQSTPTAIPTLQPTATPASLTEATPAPTEHAAPARSVTGKTTFQELLDWGVPKEVIQAIIGSDLPAPATVIKDFVVGKGLTFSSIRTQLQAEVDKFQP